MQSTRRVVYIFLFVQAIGSASTDIFLPSLPLIGRQFCASVPVVNLTISLFAAGRSVGCLFMGYISDRIGRKSTLFWCNSLYVIVSLMIAFSYSIWAMIVLRFIQGLTVAGPMIVCRQIIKESFPKELQLSAFASLSLGTFLSPAIAPVFGAYIAHLLSWRFCFVIPAVCLAVLAILTKIYTSETIVNYQKLPTIKKIATDFKCFATSTIYISYVLIAMSMFGAYFAFIALSSEIYVVKLHMNVLLYSKIFLLLAVSYLIGNKLMGILDKKGWHENKIISAGVICCVIGAGLFMITLMGASNLQKIIIISLAASMIRMGYACAVNPIASHLMGLFPERSGLALGFFLFAISMSGSICSMIVSLEHGNLLFGIAVTTLALVLISIAAYASVVKISVKSA